MTQFYICAVNTNIHFQNSDKIQNSEEHYIQYKDHRIKFVSNLEKEDDLILEMDQRKRMDDESAYHLVTEFLSVLSFSYNQPFDVRPGFVIDIPGFKDYKKLSHSCVDKRSIAVTKCFKSFKKIYSFDENLKFEPVRLYRLSKISRPIYSKFLYIWHAISYKIGEEKSVEYLNKSVKYLNLTRKKTVSDILKEQIFMKEYKKDFEFGSYIKEGLRNAIAHIERKPWSDGRSIKVDSRKDEREFYRVTDLLLEITRMKIIKDFNLPNSPNSRVGAFDLGNLR